MFPKRLLAFLLWAALAVANAGGLRAQWVSANSPDGGSVNSFATLGNKIFAGTQEIGVLVSTDGGANWTSASPDLAQTHITSLATSGSNLFAGTFYAQIYKSTDSGLSWTLLNTGAYDEIRTFEVTNGNIFAAAGITGVLRSSNEGESWSNVSSGLTSQYVNAFASIGTTIYAAGDRVFLSTNNGNSWQQFQNGLTDTECFNLATVGSNLYLGASSGIYLSRNGSSWVPTSSVLPPYPISTTTLLSVGNNLFTGTFDGVFQTTNEGVTWNSIGNDCTDSADFCQLATDGTNLIAGTFIGANNGIWERPLSDFGISSVAQTPATAGSEIQVYPNPFSNSTTISFTSEASGYAEISIVNTLGEEVAQLYSGELAAGEHSFQWGNPTGLPNGMYECLVRMNGTVQSAGIIVLR